MNYALHFRLPDVGPFDFCRGRGCSPGEACAGFGRVGRASNLIMELSFELNTSWRGHVELCVLSCDIHV